MAQKTTKDLYDSIIADLEASLNQTIPLLPKAFNRVLARVLSAVYITLYKFAGWVSLQMFPSQASGKNTTINGISINPLVEHGNLLGTGEPAKATAAVLEVEITATTTGDTLPINTQLIGANNGVVYLTTAPVPLLTSTVTAQVLAVSDQSGGTGAGSVGNLANGSELNFANPLPGVARTATVSSTVTSGEDAPTEDAYRNQVIRDFQQRPQGGAYIDYRNWGIFSSQIVNIYTYTNDTCNGSIKCFVEATPASSGNPDGIPTAGQLQAVLDAINLDVSGLATRRPVNALVNTFPITRSGFDVTVSGIAEIDDIAAVQSQIEDALTEYFLAAEPYIIGAAVPPRRDIIAKSSVSGIVEDVVAAAGGYFNAVLVEQASVVIDQYSLTEGEKAKLGSITFI